MTQHDEVWVWGLNILGKPSGLLKQGFWSPRWLGLPSFGAHRKSNSPKFLAAPGPRKIGGGKKKKEKKRFRPRGEMRLLVSRVRGLKEPAYNFRQGVVVVVGRRVGFGRWDGVG